MRAPEITISSAQVFTLELSVLRVSAQHPRAVCETELVWDLPKQVHHGASVRLPFPAHPLVAVVKSPPAATSEYHLSVVFTARAR